MIKHDSKISHKWWFNVVYGIFNVIYIVGYLYRIFWGSKNRCLVCLVRCTVFRQSFSESFQTVNLRRPMISRRTNMMWTVLVLWVGTNSWRCGGRRCLVGIRDFGDVDIGFKSGSGCWLHWMLAPWREAIFPGNLRLLLELQLLRMSLSNCHYPSASLCWWKSQLHPLLGLLWATWLDGLQWHEEVLTCFDICTLTPRATCYSAMKYDSFHVDFSEKPWRAINTPKNDAWSPFSPCFAGSFWNICWCRSSFSPQSLAYERSRPSLTADTGAALNFLIFGSCALQLHIGAPLYCGHDVMEDIFMEVSWRGTRKWMVYKGNSY